VSPGPLPVSTLAVKKPQKGVLGTNKCRLTPENDFSGSCLFQGLCPFFRCERTEHRRSLDQVPCSFGRACLPSPARAAPPCRTSFPSTARVATPLLRAKSEGKPLARSRNCENNVKVAAARRATLEDSRKHTPSRETCVCKFEEKRSSPHLRCLDLPTVESRRVSFFDCDSPRPHDSCFLFLFLFPFDSARNGKDSPIELRISIAGGGSSVPANEKKSSREKFALFFFLVQVRNLLETSKE